VLQQRRPVAGAFPRDFAIFFCPRVARPFAAFFSIPLLCAFFNSPKSAPLYLFFPSYQAMLLLAPPPPKKVARAWAHPGTDNGGVVGGEATAAARGDADESPKV
jgi:hypothetical protein